MYVCNTCYERNLSNVFEVFETSAKVPKRLWIFWMFETTKFEKK